MVADRNTKFRNYWAANILVYVGLVAISYQVGRLYSGQLLWLTLTALFVLLAVYESILGLIIAEDANGRLANWQDTLTDRFAQEEFISSLQGGNSLDFVGIWQRSTDKMVNDIRAHGTSHILTSPLSSISSVSKLAITVVFSAALDFAVTILPAVIAQVYN